MPIINQFTIKYCILFFTLSLFFSIKSAFAGCNTIDDNDRCFNYIPSFSCRCDDFGHNFISCVKIDPPYNTIPGCEDIPGRAARHYLQVDCDDGTRGINCSGAGDDTSCFLPGTKITTPTGQKNIESVKAGDTVMSFDPTTQKISENIVASVIQTTKPSYYEITTKSGRVIKATAEHPFFVGASSQNNSLKYKITNLLNRVFGVPL